MALIKLSMVSSRELRSGLGEILYFLLVFKVLLVLFGEFLDGGEEFEQLLVGKLPSSLFLSLRTSTFVK